jgi:hypothetical protein
MTQMIDNSTRVYRVEHGGECHENVAFADVPALLDVLVAKYGAPPAPVVTETTFEVASSPDEKAPSSASSNAPEGLAVPATIAPSKPTSGRGVGYVDEVGRARSEADLAAARAAGFAPSVTMYARGTRVNECGVKNARLARLEYEAKPLIGDAIADLRQRIDDEHRHDVLVPRSQVYMDRDGSLLVGEERRRLDIELDAFKQLCRRLHLPSGAGQYLSECWPELRADNINKWTDIAARNNVTDPVLLRTRKDNASKHGEVVFACVSDEYYEFDIDEFATAIEQAMPADARCAVFYDGRRVKIEVLFHSTVEPEDYVCGEFFRAAFIARTDDTGRGGLCGWSAVEQNLCLNLIVTSVNAQPVFRVAHRSDFATMARKIREGLRKAEQSLEHFLKAWGYARKDDLVASAKARGELYEGMTTNEFFAAIANGAIERELVPVRGRRDVVVPQLLEAWQADRSDDGPSAGTVTRAGLVNAFTRWAHEQNDDPWQTDRVEQGAARLLWAANDRQREPVPIPAIPLGA